MDINNVTLVGRLAESVRFFPGKNGETARATGLLVVNRVPSSRGGFRGGEPTSDVFPIVSWGKHAANMAKYTAKGKELGIEGRIKLWRSKRPDGTWDNRMEVVCKLISYGHDSEKGKMQRALEGETTDARKLLASDNDIVLQSLLDGKKNRAEILARLKEVAAGAVKKAKKAAPQATLDPFATNK